MKKIYEGSNDISHFMPIINNNAIFFAVDTKTVNTDEFHGDARSFGYPVDEGIVTVVTYDYAVGVLAEDTIALIQSLKKPKAPSAGIHPMDGYKFKDEQLRSWEEGLDPSWAEKDYYEWKAKGLIDNETKTEWIKDRKESYHCWPESWKKAYNEHGDTLNKFSGVGKIVLNNGKLTLYQDDNNDFFFATKYHDHGKIHKADKTDALQYIEKYKIYMAALKKYNELSAVAMDNMETLKATL